MSVSGLFISTTGNAVKATFDDLADYQQAVGGYIEAVDIKVAGHEATIYLNEEGKMFGLPLNRSVTRLATGRIFEGDYIAGDVVIVGGGYEGDTLSLHPDAQAFILDNYIPA